MVVRRSRIRELVAGNTTLGGIPLHATEGFLAAVIVLGVLGGWDVAKTQLVVVPEFETLDQAMHAFDQASSLDDVIRPPIGWAVLAGVGVAIVYALSIVVHELAHLAAARVAGMRVAAVRLTAMGGSVELEDDDALTAGRLAAIAAAGPLASGVLALLAAVALTKLGWPLTGVPIDDGAGAAAIGRVLSVAFVVNAVALVVNLAPVRPLDGSQLLAAARLWRGRTRG
jgi:Zn-dependent protease